MKKIFLCAVSAILLSGCGASATMLDANIVVVGEKMFIEQCNDIYINSGDYEDKTIVLEGMYAATFYDGVTYHIVYRRSPGCCGDDGQVGFEFSYGGEMPAENDWIKVTGTPEIITDPMGYDNVLLNVTEIEIMDERGAEFVQN